MRGQVQLLQPDLFAAKQIEANLYHRRRELDPSSPEAIALKQQGEKFYGPAMEKAGAVWAQLFRKARATSTPPRVLMRKPISE